MGVAGVVAVVITVGLYAAGVLLGADVAVLPYAVGVGEGTIPALGDVKHVVVHVDSEEVLDADRATEELYTIVCTLEGEDVLDLGAGADAIESERIVLYVVILRGTAVLELEVLDGAGVVVCLVATVGVLRVDLRLGGLLAGGEGCEAIDDESAPCTGLLLLSSEGDRGLCGTLYHDLTALLNEDVLVEAGLCGDGGTCGDGEGGTALDEECTGERVGDSGIEGHVLGDIAAQVLSLGLSEAVTGPAEDGCVASGEVGILGVGDLILIVRLDQLACEGSGELIIEGDGELTIALLVGGVDEVLCLTLTLDEGVGNLSSGTTTDLEDVVEEGPLLLRGGLIEDDGNVLDGEVGLIGIIGVVAS